MILKIAFRNTLRQKRRTALTSLTMLGGFILAAVSIGWSDGTYSYIIDMFTSDRLGQIEVHRTGYLEEPSIYDRIQDYRNVGRIIRTVEGVESWAPRVYSAGLASLEDKTAGVRLIGMDPDMEETATGFSRKVVEGAPLAGEPYEALLGKGLARILGARIGDGIVLLTQAADGSMANDVFNVTGIVDTGDETGDRLGLYLNLSDAQNLLVIGEEVHEIVVMVDNLKRVGAITESIRDRLDEPGLEVLPWQKFARLFYEAMRADQQGMWIMLFIIILIVAVGVLNTVLMSVLERRREYGLLKAIGTRPAQIVHLVLMELLVIVLVSVALGGVLSLGVNWLISIRGIPIPMEITYGGMAFDRMYSEINARSLYIPAVTVIISAFLVGVFPAIKAAKTEPARAMRTF
ncbi:MAG: ABC transporter permease [Acidobacteria bacterium]|nr:ABC transporter permease [Acidobacteriota bacterium]